MAITSFYLLQMFPQMRTYSSSPNNQYPTPKPNMFPRMRTSSSVNIQHPVLDTQTKHLPLDEHFIINQYSSPNNQAKHVPSDAHFIISQHSTPSTQPPNKTSSLRRTYHHHPIFITQKPDKTCSLRCALCFLWRIIFMKKNNYLREKKYFSS